MGVLKFSTSQPLGQQLHYQPPFSFPFLRRIKWHVYENTAIVNLGFGLLMPSTVRNTTQSWQGRGCSSQSCYSGPWYPIAKTSDLNNADCTHGADPCLLLPSPL